MNWQSVVERTVTALGYDPVDLERSSGGLLRVFIDRPHVGASADASGHANADAPITVDDCEKVTRQLQVMLDVEAIDYARLEVSSPGLDRPLRKPADWQRFAGSRIELTLRAPRDGRRKWSGVLQLHAEGGWQLVVANGNTERRLDFSLDEVREARLIPVLDFKGRRARDAAIAGGQQQ